MKFWAVVPAAGAGARFSTQVSKQFLSHKGQFVFTFGLRLLLEHPAIAGVVLTTQDIPTQPAPAYRHWLDFSAEYQHKLHLVPGGSERVWSVRAGVKALLSRQGWQVSTCDYVLVHDGVRPCLHYEDLSALIQSLKTGAATVDEGAVFGALLGKPVTDTLKRVKGHQLRGHVDRSELWQAQTPQGFPVGALEQGLDHCFAQALSPSIESSVPTDECQIMADRGASIAMVQAKHPNPKLTYTDDLPLILQVIDQNSVQ